MTDDLEPRVAALEERMDMESGLRAAVDCDVADIKQTLRAQHLLVQALSITQSQHTSRLTALHEWSGRMDEWRGRMDERTGRMEVTMEAMRVDHMSRLTTITGMLTQLIERDTGRG